MSIQRSGHIKFARMLVRFCCLACMGLMISSGIAQGQNASSSTASPGSVAVSNQDDSQPGKPNQSSTTGSENLVHEIPKEVVRVLFDPDSNRVTLVGTAEDIAIVKRAILDLKSKRDARPDFTIERITLTYQLSETVVDVVTNAMRMQPQTGGLQISALHFPEAILLSGPPSTVKKAKAIIGSVDSHDYFSNAR